MPEKKPALPFLQVEESSRCKQSPLHHQRENVWEFLLRIMELHRKCPFTTLLHCWLAQKELQNFKKQ